jgi:hypothetical protein
MWQAMCKIQSDALGFSGVLRFLKSKVLTLPPVSPTLFIIRTLRNRTHRYDFI